MKKRLRTYKLSELKYPELQIRHTPQKDVTKLQRKLNQLNTDFNTLDKDESNADKALKIIDQAVETKQKLDEAQKKLNEYLAERRKLETTQSSEQEGKQM